MKFIFSLIVTTVLLFSQTINEQIHALENASPEKRVELMNSIKKQLISMNQEKRMSTINSLREKLQVKHQERTHEIIPQENLNSEHVNNRNREHQNSSNMGLHLEQYEQQEQMINSTHIKERERHQFIQNHREQENFTQQQNHGEQGNFTQQQNHSEQQTPERESGQRETRENNYHNSER